MSVDLDVPARMRDGVVLRANVYRPDGDGPWPTLLLRTPYCKDALEAAGWPGLDPVQAARRGFMVVAQDTRGRFRSEGEWEPFRHEAEDGFDSVEWAARLEGSSGRVGMYGGSYHGCTQWLAAIERPPALGAIAPTMTWSEPMDGVFARGGAVELGLGLMWALIMGRDDVERGGADPNEQKQRVDGVVREWDRLAREGYWTLPVAAAEPLRRHGVRDIGALSAIADPESAERCRVVGSYDRVEVPTFHTAGWFDQFLQGTLDNFQAMQAARGDARLVVGPWAHTTFADPVGDLAFGMSANREETCAHAGRSWIDLQLDWFRRALGAGGEANGEDWNVRYFVMGRNEWRLSSTWPPPAVSQRWFLRAGHALTPSGAGDDETASEFAYDPAQPVPTVGGPAMMGPGYRTGPVEQAAVERRSDVLVFTSEPLPQELEVTGRVRVVIHAESTAPSTDWVARLCDVDPQGRSFNLCDGILRVGQRADACGRHEIDLWSTSHVLRRGHRLRVQVTSSSFPRWDRNLNTGDQAGTAHQVAHQRVYHDRQRPSYIELPVVGL